MFIETEGTPNPATLKFLPGQEVLAGRTADFPDADAALISPLANTLFGLPGVARVFLGADFITVTKTDATDWQSLRPQVLGAIMEHFVAGLPVMSALAGEAAAIEDVQPEDHEIVEQIKDLLETRIRPAVASDGGDIIFRGFQRRRGQPANARLLQRLPLLNGNAEARHRKPAKTLHPRSAIGHPDAGLISCTNLTRLSLIK